VPINYPKRFRLTTSKDYHRVFQAEKKLYVNGLLGLVRTNTLSHPRLGIIVGKKKVAKAVKRNRIKRIIRESFRHRQDELKSVDIVIVLRHFENDNQHELVRELNRLWKKLINLQDALFKP